MLKLTETSKKFKIFEKKLQKFQVVGKNLKKNFKYLEKIAKMSSIWKKLQKSHNFGECIVAFDLILNILLRIDFKNKLRLYVNWHYFETMIQNFE